MPRIRISEEERRRRRLESYRRYNTKRRQGISLQAAVLNRMRPQVIPFIGRDPSVRPEKCNVGHRDSICGNCRALHFALEANQLGEFTKCCNGGKVILDPFPPYPEMLMRLITTRNSNFRKNIRKYNSALSFASFGHTSVRFPDGPPALVIHGAVHHRTAATVNGSVNQNYANLYFIDPDHALQARVNVKANKLCLPDVFRSVDELIRQINPYAAAYRMLREVYDNVAPDQRDDVQMCLVKDRHMDLRRYNLPIANEVAAVFTSADGAPPFNRDIAVHPREGESLQQLSMISPHCDPMCYTLLFPHGTFGWSPNMEKCDATERISMQQYYAHRLQERDGEFNPLLHAGKLSLQFIIDAFMKIEGSRLEWVKNNQTTLRVDCYLGLMDFVNQQASDNDLRAGRMHILPSSFTGSRRAMQQNYQDAMAYVAQFGRPDLFITFTCNPKWPEIQAAMEEYEDWNVRPDIIATVFHLKLEKLRHELEQKKIFGSVVAMLYVIEFQKRGMPHMHLLLILDSECKIKDSDQVDQIICAELPDPDEDPELYQIVTSCMIHKPCGYPNSDLPCMDQDASGKWICTKRYPKDFCERTDMNVDGYPKYRRRDDGRKFEHPRHHYIADNRHVVPYNPYLTRLLDAHINVEICASVKGIKYLFKYCYKGHDAAVVKVNERSGAVDYDEVQSYLDARYISAPEAMWRIREYHMHHRSIPVERLPVHLPQQQTVYFKAGNEQQALESAQKRGTKLTAWFRLNQDDESARQYTYAKIPLHYVWDQKESIWKERQRGTTIPRMYAVSPKDTERFALRLLLLHVCGATSFESLRTVDGEVKGTFREAAKALNLLDDDTLWVRTMEEAALTESGFRLRQLFCTILISSEPSDPLSLYNSFKDYLCEDFAFNHDSEVAEQLSLKNIEETLLQFGRINKDFGLPAPQLPCVSDFEFDLDEETVIAAETYSKLNDDQRLAFDRIMDSVRGNTTQKCFYLSGAGGCGKTFLYRALTAAVLATGKKVKAVAPTGLAATLLKHGQTVHSGFKLGINIDNTTVSRITLGSAEYTQLLDTTLIIWDEISMCHTHLFQAVDRSLRDLLSSHLPFGGITIVVGGDFRQQAPVVKKAGRVETVEACVKTSPLWQHFIELALHQNMRVASDEGGFADWLLTVGNGLNEGPQNDYVAIPNNSLTDNIIEAVYGHDIAALTDNELNERAILCPKNDETLSINEQILNAIPGSTKTYLSTDSVHCESEEERMNYPIEFINSLTPMGTPPHRLNLKVNCIVMLLRNLSPKRGLCNGTRLKVLHLGDNVIQGVILSGDFAGTIVLIPRIIMDSQDDMPFTIRRKQFPLRLAYAMTITKSQGQTFKTIGLYLPQPVFTHGQLYTALSRVRSSSGLHIQLHPTSRQGQLFEGTDNIYTMNCVFREIL